MRRTVLGITFALTGGCAAQGVADNGKIVECASTGACIAVDGDKGLSVVDTPSLTLHLPAAMRGSTSDVPSAGVQALAYASGSDYCNLTGVMTWTEDAARWTLRVSLACDATSGSFVGYKNDNTYTGSK